MSNAVERLDDWLRDYDREALEAQVADLEARVEALEETTVTRALDRLLGILYGSPGWEEPLTMERLHGFIQDALYG